MTSESTTTTESESAGDQIVRSDAEWRAELSPEQFAVLRQGGTERAFSGQYWNVHTDGSYLCAACGATLFDSRTKFDSGTGWPSFTEPAVHEAVETRSDTAHGMQRTEVICRRCQGHLGHVFDDGPDGKPRFCINSASLHLEPREEGTSG